MYMTKRTVASALGLLVALGISGAALAASHPSRTTSSRFSQVSMSDTDNVEQGDRTGSDTTDATDPTASASATGSDESSSSDGPGGHQDPRGNIDHRFQGQE